MEIHQLELLDILVEQKSFKKAARQCFVSTSTLARQISAMELELGFPLFERSAYGISLTEQGEIFFRETRGTVKSYEKAVQSARRAQSRQQLVRIGTYPYIKKHITHACDHLRRQYPDVLFSFTPTRFTDSCTCLLNHKTDLILLGETQEANDEIFCLPIFMAYNIVIVSENHPFADRGSMNAEVLNGQTILMPKERTTNKNMKKMRKLFQLRCPDSEMVDYQHPDQADAMCLTNNALISSISLLNVDEGFRQIRITDAPMVEIGLMCRKEDRTSLESVMHACRDYFISSFDPSRAEIADLP